MTPFPPPQKKRKKQSATGQLGIVVVYPIGPLGWKPSTNQVAPVCFGSAPLELARWPEPRAPNGPKSVSCPGCIGWKSPVFLKMAPAQKTKMGCPIGQWKHGPKPAHPPPPTPRFSVEPHPNGIRTSGSSEGKHMSQPKRFRGPTPMKHTGAYNLLVRMTPRIIQPGNLGNQLLVVVLSGNSLCSFPLPPKEPSQLVPSGNEKWNDMRNHPTYAGILTLYT